MKTSDYIITKASYSNNILEAVEIFKVDENDSIGSSENISRADLVSLLQQNKSIYTGRFNENNTYTKILKVYLHHNFLSSSISTSPTMTYSDSLGYLPKQLPKRKTFVSFYHKDDEAYRIKFSNLTKDLTINKSVKSGDINTDVSTEYISRLIREGYLSDTTLLTVLIGPKTRCRKHVDWEIAGALNWKVGDKHAGLIGILLPEHPDYNKSKFFYSNIPARLSDNHKTGYAVILNWTNDRVKLQNLMELAFDKRSTHEDEIDNTRTKMARNTCE